MIRKLAIAIALMMTPVFLAPAPVAAINISEETPWVAYTASASQTVFAYDFPIFDDDDLLVYSQNALLTKTADYTVSGVGVEAGGNVTLLVGATASDAIVIARDAERARSSQYSVSRPFDASQLDDDLNRILNLVQDLQLGIQRSMVRPQNQWNGSPLVLPQADVTKVIGWAASGQPVNVDPDAVGTGAAALNSVIPGGTRTVATMQDYLSNGAVHNVLDYGAVVDDALDDAAAIQLALTAANLAGGGVVWVPTEGIYQLDTQLTIDDNTALVCEQKAILRRNWVGVSGVKPDNATIRNADAPASAAIAVDPGPFVPSTFNTRIKIVGCEFDVTDSTMIGSHVALYAVKFVELRDLRFRGVEQDWNVAIFGDYVDITGLDIDSGDVVFEDGIHVIGGTHIRISNSRIKCGDDAIALISNLNLAISDVTVSNITVESQQGQAIKIGTTRAGATAAFGQPTSKIERIVITNVVGQAGIDKNGLIHIAQDGVTDKTLTRDVTISNVRLKHGTLASAPRSGTSGANDFGVQMDGGLRFIFDNVTLDSPIRDGWRLVDVDDVKIIDSDCFGIQETGTGRSCIVTVTGADNLLIRGNRFQQANHHIIHLTDATNVIVADNELSSIGASLAGILLDGTTGTIRTAITGNIFTGAASSQGVRVASAGVDSLHVSGNNFGTVTSPLVLSNTPSDFTFESNTSEETRAIASTATLQLPDVGPIISVTGTADVTTLNTGWEGRDVVLRFSSTAATNGVVDGSNLVLNGNFAYTAGDTLHLRHNGSNWLELSRSAN